MMCIIFNLVDITLGLEMRSGCRLADVANKPSLCGGFFVELLSVGGVCASGNRIKK
jgi:hypothetical protein